MAEGIVKIKKNIINRISPIVLDSRDIVGRVVSDVDFAIWNNSTSLTIILPNFLMMLASLAAMMQLNLLTGLITIFLILPLLFITEWYMRRVEEARNVERSFYSQSIHFAERFLNDGRSGLKDFQSSLDK